MPTRVLILSASVGSGHKAAAAAIEQAFQRYPEFEVINQDALQHTSRIYQVAATDAYFALVKENPWSVGWLYDYNDEPFKNERGLSRVLNMLNGQPLVKLIEDYHPDIIICTHFMPAGIAAQLLLEERINSRLGIVTTDYDFQGMWLSRSFNHYFVALEEARALLASFGVDDERITVSGIPVTPQFTEPFDGTEVCERYNLQLDLPTLLVSAGALGGGPALEIVEQIMGMKTPVQTIVVCGRNQPLRQAVTTLTSAKAEHFRVLGFTNEMPDLMRTATLFVGKPGGLSTAECMA
ncbi:MAG: galactosyldiacylglycerol synthase, partial [Chloroflexia bacterium]|nr:galactosyldiacylglycerol synthase [Chloroflexia bacterium]